MTFQPGRSGNPAGRPRRREKFARPIAAAERKIADRLPDIVDKLLELVEGIDVQRQTIDGPRVYSQAPDRAAAEYLLNRIMGKPTERQELSGKDGGPIEHDNHLDDDAARLIADLIARGIAGAAASGG